MGGLSLTHIIFAAVIILLLFGGRGKISEIMGDFAKGIKSFKKGMADDDEQAAPPPPQQPVETIRSEAPIVIEHQREVETPADPAPKPRAKTSAKSAAKSSTKKAPATKTPARKKAEG